MRPCLRVLHLAVFCSFLQSVLLEELEKLEKSLDESLFEADRKEQEVLAASPSNHGEILAACGWSRQASLSSAHSFSGLILKAKLEEEDIAEDLEYLRQWANSL